MGIIRSDQEKYAVASHQKAVRHESDLNKEILAISGQFKDAFTRHLSPETCARFPVITGDCKFGLTNTTVSVEADAAAAVLICSEKILNKEGEGKKKKMMRI